MIQFKIAWLLGVIGLIGIADSAYNANPFIYITVLVVYIGMGIFIISKDKEV